MVHVFRLNMIADLSLLIIRLVLVRGVRVFEALSVVSSLPRALKGSSCPKGGELGFFLNSNKVKP
jgi:hypothetical protein